MPSLLHSRRIRWAAPVLVIAMIGLLAVVPTISAGAATPTLPPLSPQALLAKAQTAKTSDLPGLAGTIQLSTNLGIPSLSEFSGAVGGQGFNPVDFLSGAHSANVWISKSGFKATYSDSSTTEDDVISNGKDLWTWQSQGTKVTHTVLADHSATAKAPATATAPDSPEANSPVKTPDQVAQKLLSSIDPSTAVAVQSPVYVANHRASYQLVLSPKAPGASTVDHVTVAVDAATGLPDRVQIFARGPKPVLALQFGFSKLNIGAQRSKLFTFTPPPGATVTTTGAPKPAAPSSATPPVRHRVFGSGHRAVTDPALPVGTTKLGKPTVVGTDWTTVYVYHGVQVSGQYDRALSQAATPVKNATGTQTGRLFSTALVNVLLLNNGNVAVGAVNVSALWAAASAG